MHMSLADLTDRELSELSGIIAGNPVLTRVSINIALEMRNRDNIERSDERMLLSRLKEEGKNASRATANITRMLNRVTR